jgi:hypothetical protein
VHAIARPAQGDNRRNRTPEERFNNPLVRVDDDIAMVWAHYDFLVDGDVHHWGTNILSFLKQDGHWCVSSVADNGRSGPRPQSWEVT